MRFTSCAPKHSFTQQSTATNQGSKFNIADLFKFLLNYYANACESDSFKFVSLTHKENKQKKFNDLFKQAGFIRNFFYYNTGGIIRRKCQQLRNLTLYVRVNQIITIKHFLSYLLQILMIRNLLAQQ